LAGRLRFAAGLRLRAEHADWVRHELTDAGWRGRVVARHLTVMVPVCLALALLPAPVWLRVMVPALALAGSLFTVTAVADDIRAARLRQHGLPVPDDPDDPDAGLPPH